MSRSGPPVSSLELSNRMERYYRFHSRIYDATRWSFLFGREALLRQTAAIYTPHRILEVGCGTGKNLISLARRFAGAEITGLDISATMLEVARKNLGPLTDRVHLVHRAYDEPLRLIQPDRSTPLFDLVLFSYSLTMINPGWEQVIESGFEDLAPGSRIGVVDFHDSALPIFRRWMGLNHVRMDGHLLPKLDSLFKPTLAETRPAYGGLWRYLIFIGEKPGR